MATGRRSSDDQALLPTTASAGAAQQPPPAPALVYACFFAIPLGYAGPWVMIGALISYIKAQHGSEAYRLMYLCYYAAGLPMSLLQQRYDATADAKYVKVLLLVRLLLLVLLRRPPQCCSSFTQPTSPLSGTRAATPTGSAESSCSSPH